MWKLLERIEGERLSQKKMRYAIALFVMATLDLVTSLYLSIAMGQSAGLLFRLGGLLVCLSFLRLMWNLPAEGSITVDAHLFSPSANMVCRWRTTMDATTLEDIAYAFRDRGSERVTRAFVMAAVELASQSPVLRATANDWRVATKEEALLYESVMCERRAG